MGVVVVVGIVLLLLLSATGDVVMDRCKLAFGVVLAQKSRTSRVPTGGVWVCCGVHRPSMGDLPCCAVGLWPTQTFIFTSQNL